MIPAQLVEKFRNDPGFDGRGYRVTWSKRQKDGKIGLVLPGLS